MWLLEANKSNNLCRKLKHKLLRSYKAPCALNILFLEFNIYCYVLIPPIQTKPIQLFILLVGDLYLILMLNEFGIMFKMIN